MQNARVSFRLAEQKDIPYIVLNEQQSFHIPWRQSLFESCLQEQYRFWVISKHDHIIGHLIIQNILNESHLLNICIIPQYQHQGIGKSTMQYWMNYCQKNHLVHLYLEVRQSNTKAHTLYYSLGFKQIAIRSNYYPTLDKQREDAQLLYFRLKENSQ